MNEQSRNKEHLIVSLLNQLSKQKEYITSPNNRFSNNPVDNYNNNNDNFSHKNNSYTNNSNNNDNNNNFIINPNCLSTISN